MWHGRQKSFSVGKSLWWWRSASMEGGYLATVAQRRGPRSVRQGSLVTQLTAQSLLRTAECGFWGRNYCCLERAMLRQYQSRAGFRKESCRIYLKPNLAFFFAVLKMLEFVFRFTYISTKGSLCPRGQGNHLDPEGEHARALDKPPQSSPTEWNAGDICLFGLCDGHWRPTPNMFILCVSTCSTFKINSQNIREQEKHIR